MKTLCRSNNGVTLTDLTRVLPSKPLFGTQNEETIGWLLSPEPFGLEHEQIQFLESLGTCLHQFAKATQQLYRNSLKDPQLYWVRDLFHQGKPESLIAFSQMNRFKSQYPLVIRPDLLLTADGFALTEVDSVPGGIGFTAALQQAYEALGFQLLGADEGIPRAFLSMLNQLAPDEKSEPFIAVVVSDEAADYLLEMAWLVEAIQDFYPNIQVIHPRSVAIEGRKLGFYVNDNRFQPIDIIYRFFELFDLPNIPQIELIQYAIKKGLVACTPPFKPYLEEKLALALIHYPFLAGFWEEHLGSHDFAMLKQLIPESWILDPQPIPPHAQVVPSLAFDGKVFRDFTGLSQLTQKQRRLVVKPSGFSPLAWGSRGVTVGHDVSQQTWAEVLDGAFGSFGQTPYLLQRYENPDVTPYRYFNTDTGQVVDDEGRNRICPYYFVIDDIPRLVGVLTTTCPKNKKIIHGMRDGVMRPVCQSALNSGIMSTP